MDITDDPGKMDPLECLQYLEAQPIYIRTVMNPTIFYDLEYFFLYFIMFRLVLRLFEA